MDLLGPWGEEAVQAQLQSSYRNTDIYKQIAHGTGETGYKRDVQQCHLKVKEPRDLMTTAKSRMDTSGELEPQAHKVNSEEVVFNEEEEEEYVGQTTGRTSGEVNQDLFLTPKQSS
ncbi:hypothetical protein UY3_07748 [Chelonia mydas]|uniref:Myb/SANT-like DNA-binding domain-containing protein n=1 Tax=Chelonia mydas TaxID=8469 RepID=M7BD38_CHEMY|nr:hypothetical protein UY3_07748 [Chelonia mydas]